MTRYTLLLTLCAAALATGAVAEPVKHYAENAYSSVRAIDGDSLVVSGETIRLRSAAGPIDAPELRKAKCPLELFRAEAAKDRLATILYEKPVCSSSGPASCTGVHIERHGMDRYGRTVAVVYLDGDDIGARLVAEGFAKPWPTLRRKDRPTWCGG